MGVEGASQVDDHYSPEGKLKKVPVSLWKLGKASYPQANLPWGLQECWGTSRTGPHLWEAVFLWAPMTYQGAAGDWGSISKLTRWSIHRTLSTWPHYKGRTVFFFNYFFFRGLGRHGYHITHRSWLPSSTVRVPGWSHPSALKRPSFSLLNLLTMDLLSRLIANIQRERKLSPILLAGTLKVLTCCEGKGASFPQNIFSPLSQQPSTLFSGYSLYINVFYLIEFYQKWALGVTLASTPSMVNLRSTISPSQLPGASIFLQQTTSPVSLVSPQTPATTHQSSLFHPL